MSPKELESALEALDGMSEQMDVEAEISRLDRERMVTPAPPGSHPKAKGPKIEIELSIKKKMMRRGEPFLYRLEVRNIGDADIRWTHRFFKFGGPYGASKWDFLLTGPDGKESKLWVAPARRSRAPCHSPEELSIPSDGSEESKQETVRRWKLESEAKSHFRLTLHPGEIIRTDAWRHVSNEEFCRRISQGLPGEPKLKGEYQEFFAYQKLKKTGTYKLKVVLDERSKPLPEKIIQTYMKHGLSREEIHRSHREDERDALGWVESNVVSFEVVP